jgi:hypothetical protein
VNSANFAGTEFYEVQLRDAEVSAGLPVQVRLFLGGTLEGYPDLDVRLLAAARRQERSEEGPEALTKVMRQLL